MQLQPEYLQKLHDDYIFFVEEIWRIARPDKGMAPIGPTERDILKWVAYGPSRRGVLAPRSIGKTTWGTCTLATWHIFRDPDAKVLIVSKSETHAKKIVKLIRAWLDTVPFLTHLAPRPSTTSRVWRDNTDMFDAGPSAPAKDPTCYAVGITGQLGGPRASIVIGDDVEQKENTKTPDAREELDERVKEFAQIASYGAREIIYFGTYHHEQSLYIKLNGRNYQFRTWPLLYPDPKDQILNLSPELQQKLDRGEKNPGDIVFDHRIGLDYVQDMKAEGRVTFAMQQMLIANMGDQTLYPLRLRDLIVFPVQRDKAPISIAWGTTNDKGQGTRIPDIPCLGLDGDALFGPIFYDDKWAPYARTCMWIDPAKGKLGGDKIGYAIVAQGRGYLWTKAVGAISGKETVETMTMLAMLAREHRVNEIHVEDFALQVYFAQLLEPVVNRLLLRPGQLESIPDGWRCAVSATKPPMPQSQKEHRIIGALDPILAQHRLVVSPEVAQNDDLQYQLTRITRQRDCLSNDDEIDALANCVALFADDLAIDPDKAAQRERDYQLELQIEAFQRGDTIDRFMHYTTPTHSSNHNWLSIHN